MQVEATQQKSKSVETTPETCRPMSKKDMAILLGEFSPQRSTMYRKVDALLKPHNLRLYAPNTHLWICDLDSMQGWMRRCFE